VINAHPRLGAARNTLSALSLKEQGYNTTQTATEDEKVNETLTNLNDQYETKFGFKFVIFVNGRKRKDILPIIEEKINGEYTKEQELQRGLKDMILIARDRLRKMGQN
jgi:2-oxo-4-hydroxy-4-carboxy--5-ureidoimidazoline (OHCU) decarboxylase